jgi:hypothetical protein
MKFAYADPPYLHMGGKYTEYHDEALIWNDPQAHINLINSLVDEYPDGWAVSLSVPSLQLYLANSPTDVRVAAWTKTFHQIRVNVAIQYAWEPIIWRGGRKQTPVKPMVRDWHSGRIAMKKGLFGAKPKDFNHYILDLLQWQIGDELIDLFEGTKGMQKAIDERFKNDE